MGGRETIGFGKVTPGNEARQRGRCFKKRFKGLRENGEEPERPLKAKEVLKITWR
ncbi:MAG: hypothetical protein WHT46_07380 [Candidatus Geothermincolales bacterium]